MLTKNDDLWTWHAEKKWIIICTNIGWKKDGSNPMGAGVARVAAEKYPDLPAWYGGRCRKYGERTAVTPYYSGNLFMFPTKPLNEEQPWMSWRNDACISLIMKSCRQLVKLADMLEENYFMTSIGLPLPGCGNGNLMPRDVLPILADLLDDRFVLLERRL